MSLPTTTAEGAIALSKEYLAHTIAACARWQTIAGAEDETEGLARIYIDALPPPTDNEENVLDEYTPEMLTTLRPFCLIGNPPRDGYRAARIADNDVADAGSLVAMFEFAVAEEDRDNLSEALRKIDNAVGVIIREMNAIAYLPGYLAIDRYKLDGPWRCEDDEINSLGDHVYALLTVYWNGGLEG